ncbi:hypothetical protein BKA93DRAFT_34264 [Sparassis latifolia]
MCVNHRTDPAFVTRSYAALPGDNPPLLQSQGSCTKGTLNIIVEPGLLSIKPHSPVSPSCSDSSSSPTTPVDMHGLEPCVAVADPAEDDCWNLIPYHIPWGPEYYNYKGGTLPGPDGKTCIFLRSPTPLKNRRTEKACNKCRERKAKCSGTQPACARCVSRGYICTYVSETKRSRGSTLSRQRRREKRVRAPSPHLSESWSTSSFSRFGSPTSSCSRPFSPKPKYEEVDDMALSPQLLYPDESEIDYWAVQAAENSLQWAQTTTASSVEDAPSQPVQVVDTRYDYTCDGYGTFAASVSVPADIVAPQPLATSSSRLSLYAPRPVKPFVPFLSPAADSILEHERGITAQLELQGMMHPDQIAYVDELSYGEPIAGYPIYEFSEDVHSSRDIVYLDPYSVAQQYHMSMAAVYTQTVLEPHVSYSHYPISLPA